MSKKHIRNGRHRPYDWFLGKSERSSNGSEQESSSTALRIERSEQAANAGNARPGDQHPEHERGAGCPYVQELSVERAFPPGR